MIYNKFLIALVSFVFSFFCMPAMALEQAGKTIHITYPDTLLHKHFYNSSHNLMVNITGTISGQHFQGVIPVLGIKTVNPQAFTEVSHTLKKMLANMPDEIKFGIIASHIKIVIIADAHGQQLTDMPEYSDLPPKYNNTEGVGATFYTKTQSIGEKNITCMDLSPKRPENVFTHEFAHVVFDIGLGYYYPDNYKDAPSPPLPPKHYHIDKKTRHKMQQLFNGVNHAYQHAKAENIYQTNVYMIKDATEYFAEGSQSYFNSQSRNDVNAINEKYKISMLESANLIATKLDIHHKAAQNFINHSLGINTYTRLRIFDPALFSMMQKIYGKEKPWNFCASVPTYIPNCRFYCITDD